MNFQNLYGFSLKIRILQLMKEAQAAGEKNTIASLLNTLLIKEDAAGKITKKQRAQLRQRVYVFIENAVKTGDIERKINIDERKRADIHYVAIEN
jgi:hypothetical protein